MSRIKLIFQHTMMISFGILVGMAVQSVIYFFAGSEFKCDWYFPLAIVCTAFLCAVASSIFLETKDGIMSKSQVAARIIIHFVSIMVTIMILGRLFKWYTDLEGAAFVAADVIGIYIFVWGASWWMGFIEQGKINRKLNEIRDEE